MITGGCPYDDCNNSHLIPIADKCPAFEKIKCEGCGKFFWMYHSRLDPIAYTEAGFNKEFIIDEETKSVERRT